MNPLFFSTPMKFRKWLEKNHQTESFLIVGFYKVKSKKESMTWSESVDEALCFGWIDGVRKSIDKDAYQIRFTPRRKNSVWSAVNIKKIKKLTKLGLMQPAGIAIYKNRDPSNGNGYSYGKMDAKFPLDFEKQFKENKKAWEYFQNLAPSYRKLSIHWVTSAKQEKTRLKRFKLLLIDSEKATNRWKDNKYKK